MGLALNATGDKVDHGSASSLDGLSAFTLLFWVKLGSIAGTDNYIWSRLNDGGSNYHWFGVMASSSELKFQVLQATTNMTCQTSGAGITTGTWYFLAATYSGTSPRGKIYIGTLDSLVDEASYGSQTNGSGAKTSDDAQNWMVGNRASGGRNANGQYSWHAAWNRVLTLDEIRQQQFAPHVTDGCILFTHFGAGGANTAYDYSGSANHGTGTGASVGDTVPLGNWFGHSMRPYLSLPLAGASGSVAAPAIATGGLGQTPTVSAGAAALTPAAGMAAGMATPVVTGVGNATVAVGNASAGSQACAPTVSGVRAASVPAPIGAALGGAAGPGVSGSAQVNGTAGQARGQAAVPGASGAALVAAQAGVGRGTGQAQAVSGAAASRAPAGQASGAAQAVGVSGAARVGPPSGAATGQAPSPAAAGVRNASVEAPTADCSALTLAPAVSGQAGQMDALVLAVMITAIAAAQPARVGVAIGSGELVEFADLVRQGLRLDGRIAQAWDKEAAIRQQIEFEVER